MANPTFGRTPGTRSVAQIVGDWATSVTNSPAFTLIGKSAWPLVHAISGTRQVLGATNETTAGFMADGYGRASGEPGLVIVSSGPALANLLTPLATAQLERQPLIVLFGMTPESLESPAFQDSRSGVWGSTDCLNALGIRSIEITSRHVTTNGIGDALASATAVLEDRFPVVVGVPPDVARQTSPTTVHAPRSMSRDVRESPAPTKRVADDPNRSGFSKVGTESSVITYRRLLELVKQASSNYAKTFVDAGTARQAACDVLPQDGFLQADSSAPMGWGIGAGIGGAIARAPDPVLAICGDGSALLAGNEMATCARLGAALTLVVCVNDVLGAPYGEFSADAASFVNLPPIDWQSYWNSLGASHTFISSDDQLRVELESVRSPSAGPRVLSIRTPKNELRELLLP